MIRRVTLVLVLAAAVAVALGATPQPWMDKNTFNGRPTFKEGRDFGYYVWREGDTWHVRWTTLGAMRRFSGTVTADGGDLESLKRIDVETERRVIRPGRPPRVVVGPRGRARVAGGRPPLVATTEQDRIEKDGDDKIRFNARTDDDIDGFDFKVDDEVVRLRFALRIDGNSRPLDVEVGTGNRHPSGNPFVVSVK